MRILINSSNLHNGGGVQVAVSFIYELSLLQSDLLNIHIVASSEVADGLKRLSTNLSCFGHYDVTDVYGLQALTSSLNNKIKNYTTVFTIFGPNYLRAKAPKEIVGFAQPWIINFNNPISSKMPFLKRNKLRSKFNLQWLFFLRSDHFIVELDHVKEKLVSKKGVENKRISVVHNTVSSLYLEDTKWQPINFSKGSEDLSLGIVSRDYPHKNLDILPLVSENLRIHHKLNVRFYTTLNAVEWNKRDESFKKYVSTVGSLSADQCPSFYQQLDGVVFPSLLECFSATPLEAMAMAKPLFASDLGFVRDVCEDHAIYFNPLNAIDIANKIARYFKSDEIYVDKLSKARNHAISFSTAKNRAEQYLKIINKLS